MPEPDDTVAGDRSDPDAVPVLRPQLPPAERLLPYLERIDAARWYTNWGPLSSELESRIAARLSLAREEVVSASSGTSALTGAVLAMAGRASSERPLALLPAFTFVATAAALQQCGFEPFLVDVDPETWMLDAERLCSHHALERAGVVVPVAPYGRPVDQRPWRTFAERTGIPVVIDGAATFDRLVEAGNDGLGRLPVAMSFHTTKAFSTGEGGCVASTDAALVRRVLQALNFGFHDSRNSRSPSTNGKLSEYHAAVGLAELDRWEEKIAALQAAADCYRAQFARVGLPERLVASPDIGASYVLVQCAGEAEAARVRANMGAAGLDSRLWYGRGIQGHSAYARLGRDELPVTDALAPALLGLPLAPDLPPAVIEHVATIVASSVRVGIRS